MGRGMQTRRGSLRTVTAGAAGALLPGRSPARLAAQSRRRVTIGGRPVKVIDAHASCHFQRGEKHLFVSAQVHDQKHQRPGSEDREAGTARPGDGERRDHRNPQRRGK